MLVWRITRERYQALDGEGARLNGGRWNSDGVAVVYTSSTLSLAALEYLVHVDIDDVPDDLVALKIEVPDDAVEEEVRLEDLPDDWRLLEDDPACASKGDDWARGKRALLLRVPSAVIPHESNFLLNPAHPDAGRVRVLEVLPFAFDHRLLE